MVVMFARAKQKWPVPYISMQIRIYQVQDYSVVRPWAHLWRKFEVRGMSFKKEESGVQRKMFRDMELHIARSKRREKREYKRLLLIL